MPSMDCAWTLLLLEVNLAHLFGPDLEFLVKHLNSFQDADPRHHDIIITMALAICTAR